MMDNPYSSMSGGIGYLFYGIVVWSVIGGIGVLAIYGFGWLIGLR